MRRSVLFGLLTLFLLTSCQSGSPDATGSQDQMQSNPSATFKPIETPAEGATATSEAFVLVSVSLSPIETLTNPSGLSNGPIYSLDWSPDGAMVAASGYERVDLWDVENEILLKRLSGSEGFVWGVDWSPDGNWIAAASDGGTVVIWDLSSGQVAQTFQIPGAFCLNWSPDGILLAVGTKRGMLYLLDPSTGEAMDQKSLSDLLIVVKWSPDGALLAVGTLSGPVEIYEATGLALVQVFDDNHGQRRDANGLDWSPDGGLLASAHQDGAVRIWEIASGNLILSFSANYQWVRGVAWSPDGEKIVAGGNDKRVRIWDAGTGDLIAEVSEHQMPVWCAVWSPDGESLATGEGVYDTKNTTSQLFIWEFQE